MKTATAFETRVRGPSCPDNVILNAAVFKFDWSISPETGVESSLDFEHRSTALLALYLLSVVQKQPFRELKKPTRVTTTLSKVVF
jgi:hypothetical protein